MWWKLLLLTLYLGVLFLLSRLLEAVAWYEGGYLASRLLDPVSLSVKKLKMLLDQRGVSYAGVVEKQELTQLMEASGEVKEGELEMATLADSEDATSTNFTCGSHFYEEVEDTKDSVWVVQVVQQRHDAYMRPHDWRDFQKRVARFGVRTGIFDCSLDRRLCERKQWFSSRLVLALPLGYRAKDTVVLRDYMGAPRTRPVLDWLNSNLASRIKQISTEIELQSNWYKFNSSTERSKIRILLFSTLRQAPMFLSVLSVKFTERVTFGTVNPDLVKHVPLSLLKSNVKLPQYVILTPEMRYMFGSGVGEYLNYNSLALLLKTMHPEVNDVFLVSLVLVNVSCWLELSIVHGVVLKRLGHLLWHVGKWNFLLILLWLPALAVLQLPYMACVLDSALTLLRLLATTRPVAWVRADWLCYANNLPFIVAAFIVYALGVAIVHYKYQDATPPPQPPPAHFWTLFPWDSYTSYLFRPMSSLSTPVPSSHDYDLEFGMEMLIARLAVPNFWLRPTISCDYMADLPVWKYAGASSMESSGGGSSDTDAVSQEDGDASGTECMPPAATTAAAAAVFTCEKCRALQENAGKSTQQLEEERLESESACAKFLMDGDYKCSCQPDLRPTRKSAGKARGAAKVRGAAHGRRRSSGEESAGAGMPQGMLPSTDCAICLDSHRYGVLLCGLPCGHCFHQACIMGWLSRDNHCCPVCRWPPYKAKPCSLHLHTE